MSTDNKDYCLNCDTEIPPGPDFCSDRCTAEASDRRDTKVAVKEFSKEFWKGFPSCKGYPDCEGDLLGVEHEPSCPMFGKTEEQPSVFDFAEAYAAKKVAENNKQWESWGTVEIAVRNPSVRDYTEHWEGRALSAERRLELIDVYLEKIN